MNRVITIVTALLLAQLTLGCGSGSPTGGLNARGVSLTPLHGATLEGVTFAQAGNGVELSFTTLPTTGTFIRLELPAQQHVDSETWTADEGVLHLLVPTAYGADLGLVPLPKYRGEAVSVSISLGAGPRSVSKPPIGESNVITDLAVSDAGLGLVNLTWTQINTGDYDFNGEVNIADITPLALHLGDTLDRGALGANQTTEFWLDGDENGEINIADLTPIGVYYSSYINGYNIKKNGSTIPGSGGGAPTVTRSQATTHTGLPSTYDLQFTGSVADAWVVAPVDLAGTEGADSGGGLGPADLVANLDNISGLDLFTLIGGSTGPFGPGKFSSRVIDPIDIVDRKPLGSSVTTGLQTRISALPRGKTLLVDFRYAPTVDLATGAPKGGASIKGGAGLRSVSADIPENEQEIASVPFRMPATGSVGVTTNIDLSANPNGGYYVELTATISYPGDNPDTIPVENGYQITYSKRLAYSSSAVAQDSDGDDSYEDEGEFDDSNNDCISDSQWDEIVNGNEHAIETEYDIHAIVESINLAEGTLSLKECFIEGGGDFPPAVVVKITEETEFLLRHRTDLDPDPDLVELDPHELEGLHDPPLELEVELYALRDTELGEPVGYWAEEVRLVIDDRT